MLEAGKAASWTGNARSDLSEVGRLHAKIDNDMMSARKITVMGANKNGKCRGHGTY